MLNPQASNSFASNWNYSKPDQPGYSQELVGTCLAIQEVQGMNFGSNGQPTTPKFWPDGRPVWNIRMVFAREDGSTVTWTFAPASRAAREGKKPSVHMSLFALTGNTDMRNLIGKTLRITTSEPPNGFKWGLGNPRPWNVELVEAGPFAPMTELADEYKAPQVLANQAASGGQMQAPQQQMGYPQQMPAAQPQMAPAPMPNQYPYNPPMQPAPMPQQPQMASAPMQAMGMQPNVVAGMQALGAQPQPYPNDDLPF